MRVDCRFRVVGHEMGFNLSVMHAFSNSSSVVRTSPVSRHVHGHCECQATVFATTRVLKIPGRARNVFALLSIHVLRNGSSAARYLANAAKSSSADPLS